MSTFSSPPSADPGRRARPATRTGRRMAAVLAALALGTTACISSSDRDVASPPTTDLSGSEIRLTSALETVNSCDALLDRIKAEAVERVGPYGFGNGFYGPVFGFEDDAIEEDEAMEASAADTAAELSASASDTAESGDADAGSRGAGAEGEFSETNNQEEGVDEADLVKTDGKRLVTVSGQSDPDRRHRPGHPGAGQDGQAAGGFLGRRAVPQR